MAPDAPPAARHHITYLSFARSVETAADRDGMSEVASRVVTIPRRRAERTSALLCRGRAHWSTRCRTRWRSTARAFPGTLSPRCSSGTLRPRRLRLSSAGRQSAEWPLPCPSVLFTHNVESDIWRRHAETADESGRAMLLRAATAPHAAIRGGAIRRFDGVLAVSDADRQTFAAPLPGRAPRRPCMSCRPGSTPHYFARRTPRPSVPQLVFTGSMDWLPNEDAMLYFCREILPLIRAEEPEVTLSIVGRAPTPAVRRLARASGRRVTGRVDDVRPHVRGGAVYVVPLRIGGGTRLKIFEAMAMGKAVVSTTVGAEGLPVTDGETRRCSRTSRGASRSAVVRLIRDTRRRATRGRRASARRRCYDWSAVAGSSKPRCHNSPLAGQARSAERCACCKPTRGWDR